MESVSMIGIDLAKHVFQLHGAAADGTVLFRRKLRREKLLDFLAAQPACVVAMEACASAPLLGREIGRLGHEVRLIAPAYVKPFVKRQKNDTADAEAICEAAGRPTMRFVAVKSEAQQASAMIFKARDLLVRQRTATINALRGHLAEFGIIAPKGPAHIGRLQVIIEEEPNGLPDPARALCQDLLEVITSLSTRIRALDHEVARRARQDDTPKRLMTIPGIGPVIATAVEALAPPVETFDRGRDFAAWMGLTPVRIRPAASRGSARLRKWVSVICVGSSSSAPVPSVAARAVDLQTVAPAGSWLERMLATSRACSLPWRSPTKWRGSPGR